MTKMQTAWFKYAMAFASIDNNEAGQAQDPFDNMIPLKHILLDIPEPEAHKGPELPAVPETFKLRALKHDTMENNQIWCKSDGWQHKYTEETVQESEGRVKEIYSSLSVWVSRYHSLYTRTDKVHALSCGYVNRDVQIEMTTKDGHRESEAVQRTIGDTTSCIPTDLYSNCKAAPNKHKPEPKQDNALKPKPKPEPKPKPKHKPKLEYADLGCLSTHAKGKRQAAPGLSRCTQR
ncbi:hypothetical protein BDV93DRAFT_514444 [Ceratobasidium sp. AG-I]|nr:hypothetical protein BDV93DRAFT_514444 [Ceratobasidium sp. AG-I]